MLTDKRCTCNLTKKDEILCAAFTILDSFLMLGSIENKKLQLFVLVLENFEFLNLMCPMHIYGIDMEVWIFKFGVQV